MTISYFLHIESILLPDNPDVDPRLAAHADLSVFHAGGEKLFLASYLKGSAFAISLENRDAQLAYPVEQQGPDYPQDAQLNACMIGKHVICNPKTVPLSFVEYLTNNRGRQLIPCRQGYSRCAVCVVDADSIITADRGIAASAKACGLQVLLIRPGYIRLDGFPYGFIGGAAFKLASDKLAFTGVLNTHPDCDVILQFLYKRGIEAVYLRQEPAFDIGSAIPILEN